MNDRNDRSSRLVDILDKQHFELYQRSIGKLMRSTVATNLYNRNRDLYKKITASMDHLYNTALDIIVTEDDMTVNLPDHCLWKIVGINNQKRYGIFIQRLTETMHRICNTSATKTVSMISLDRFDPFPLENGLYDEKIVNIRSSDYIWSDILIRCIDNLTKVYGKLCQIECEAMPGSDTTKLFHFWMGADGACCYQEITFPTIHLSPNNNDSMEKPVSSFDNKERESR